MANRSFLSQAIQISASALYEDGILSPHTQGVAEGQENIEGDLNVVRTLIKNALGTDNWYDESNMSVNAITDKYFIQRITPAGFDDQASGTGTSTTAFSTAIKTVSGHNDGAGTATVGGVIVDATRTYRIAIRDAATKNPIDDGQGNEVFARLSWNGSDYVLTWRSIHNGVESDYDFETSVDIDVSLIAISRRYEDLEWNQFLDPSWHDVAGLSGQLDDSNVITGPFSFMLTGLTNQEAVNDRLDKLGSVASGEGATRIAIHDANDWFTGVNVESAFDELRLLLGSDTSGTYDFVENNVLVDNDAVYTALNRLDLKWGDLASTDNGEGASLVGVEDAGGYFTGTNVEAVLQEIGLAIEDVAGWTKVWATTTTPISSGTNWTLPESAEYTPSTPAGRNMDVYLDGQLLLAGTGNDYLEISATQIAFNFTVPNNKNITVMIRK